MFLTVLITAIVINNMLFLYIVEDTVNHSTCEAGGRGLTLTKPRGYLSSHVTSERGVGGADCPWVISVARGQQVNLTLFDFGVTSRYRQSSSLCHVYASVTERTVTSEITVCGDGRREKTVYLSDTHTITVRLSTFRRQLQQDQDLNNPEIYFLFYYEGTLVDSRRPTQTNIEVKLIFFR